jgi:SAM-dependent methyltransferase
MNESQAREPSLLGVHSHYMFEGNVDERRRLDQLHQTIREDFHLWFDQALRIGGLETDPGRADWWLLDVGCGEGQYCVETLGRYPRVHWVGTDVNAVGIEAAQRATASMPNARFLVHDSREPLPAGLGPDDGFDFVMGWLFIYFMPDPRRTLADMVAALRPGGVMMFCNVPYDFIRHPDPIVQELRDLLMTLGRRVHMFDVTHEIDGWLGEMGFEPVQTIQLAHSLGGATAHGQRWWAAIVGVLAGIRHLVVDDARLISGADFDRKLDEVASKPYLDNPGEVHLRITIARKPSA